jgi:hypothetical protein
MNQVTKKKSTELSVIDFEADASEFSAELTSDDFALPFLNIIQNTSQQKKAGGGQIGDIFNSIVNLNFTAFQTAINDSLGKMNTSFQRMLLRTEQGLNMLLEDGEGLLERAGFDVSELNAINLFGQEKPVEPTTDTTTYPLDSQGNPITPAANVSEQLINMVPTAGIQGSGSYF